MALTVLVTCNYIEKNDDDAFIENALPVLDYLLENNTLSSPINGGDLFGFDVDQLIAARKNARTLKTHANLLNHQQTGECSGRLSFDLAKVAANQHIHRHGGELTIRNDSAIIRTSTLHEGRM